MRNEAVENPDDPPGRAASANPEPNGEHAATGHRPRGETATNPVDRTNSATRSAYRPTIGRIRLVVVQPPGGLVPSQLTFLESMQRELAPDVQREVPSASELAAVSAILAGTPPTRPAEWSEAESVLALHYREPFTHRDGRRVGQSVDGVVLLHGESMEPVFRRVVEGEHRPGYRDAFALTNRFVEHIQVLLRALASAEQGSGR